jgi:hypothetical protein
MTAPHRLDRLRVALSTSDSPAADLRARGVIRLHLQHAFVEITRQLLAAGASVAYGGDLRPHGFTEVLLDLLHTYARDDRPDARRVHAYLAWPTKDELTTAELARLWTVATVVPTARPAEPDPALPEDVRDLGRKADSVTILRERMTAGTDARIVLGGAVSGFVGRYPGLIEEALLAMRAGQPLYVVGGFGGAAGALADLLTGGSPPALTQAAFSRNTPGHDALAAHWPGVDVAAMTAELRTLGTAGLHNGLSEEENRALFASADIDQIVALLLRGLATIGPPQVRPEDPAGTAPASGRG